ncbi:restriction endonuclease [Photobacterium leiognathi subsp. mandapamensis]
MDWKSYEEVTAFVYSILKEKQNISILGYGNSCKVTGKSDVSHQIDVLAEHYNESKTPIKTAIECKYYKSNISKDPIMKLAEIIEDCDIDCGIIVTLTGFTEDAIKFARYRNISLIELRPPTDKDWAGKYRDMTLSFTFINPFISRFNFHTSDETAIENHEFNNSFIQYPDSYTINLNDFISNEIKKKDWKKQPVTEYNIKFPTGYYLIIKENKNTTRISINSIEFTVESETTYTKTTEYKGDDLVSLYMKLLSSDKEYHLRNDGTLKKL